MRNYRLNSHRSNGGDSHSDPTERAQCKTGTGTSTDHFRGVRTTVSSAAGVAFRKRSKAADDGAGWVPSLCVCPIYVCKVGVGMGRLCMQADLCVAVRFGRVARSRAGAAELLADEGHRLDPKRVQHIMHRNPQLHQGEHQHRNVHDGQERALQPQTTVRLKAAFGCVGDSVPWPCARLSLPSRRHLAARSA